MIRRAALFVLALCAFGTAEEKPAPNPLLIGSYKLRDDGVVDGDTIRVHGLRRSVRILAIDTEETYDGDLTPADKALMASDFAAYCKKMQGDAPTPRKYPTPAGHAATAFARSILTPGATLVLEKDDRNAPSKGGYGRTIAHVWVVPEEGERWLYAERVIRAGHSPYYVKYGRSKRFDALLRAAQADARQHKRGIWADDAKGYPHYETLLAWWERRARALDWLDAQRQSGNAPIEVGSKNSIRKLSRRVAKPEPVWIFGLIDDKDDKAVIHHDKGATLRIGGQRYIEIEIVGQELAKAMRPEQWIGELISAKGQLDREGNPLNERIRYMRLVVTDAAQIVRPESGK